jgi:hypothetical protein
MTGILNVIKFFPIAAVVQLDGYAFDAPSFAEFSTLNASEQLSLPLQFSTASHPQFAEQAVAVDPRYFVMGGRGFSDGIEKK